MSKGKSKKQTDGSPPAPALDDSLAAVETLVRGAIGPEAVWADLGQATAIEEGARDAPLVYVFIDPYCPYCHQQWRLLRQAITDGKLRVRWVPVVVLEASKRQLPRVLGLLPPNAAEGLARGPGLFVFVSLSMPRPALQRLIDQAARARASVIVRGLVKGSLRETVAQLQPLIGTRQVAVQIDPRHSTVFPSCACPASCSCATARGRCPAPAVPARHPRPSCARRAT